MRLPCRCEREKRVESGTDGDAAENRGEPVDIPALEPDRPRPLPKALPPEVIPATRPVNLAPFIAPPEEPPVTSPVKGAILPNKKPTPPPVFSPFDEVSRKRYGHDQWGVPLTTRERLFASAAAARTSGPVELSRPGRGIFVGLVVGLLAAGGYGAVEWLMSVESMYGSIVIGLVVGWSMYLAWGRQSFAVGVWSAIIAGLCFAVAVVLAMSAAAANQYM
jgi:hypothetical protein